MLSSGGAQTASVLLGAYVYFAVPASSAGSNASLSEGTNTNFDLNGYVVSY